MSSRYPLHKEGRFLALDEESEQALMGYLLIYGRYWHAIVIQRQVDTPFAYHTRRRGRGTQYVGSGTLGVKN